MLRQWTRVEIVARNVAEVKGNSTSAILYAKVLGMDNLIIVQLISFYLRNDSNNEIR